MHQFKTLLYMGNGFSLLLLKKTGTTLQHNKQISLIQWRNCSLART